LTMSRIAARATGLAGLVLVVCAPVSAQELEPKAYSASPVGATFLLTSVARSTGSIVFDPSIPITDVDATINAAFFGIGTTFDMFGKLALVSVAVPYAWGDVSGRVFEEARTVSRAGLADARIRFSVNLRGNDAMRLGEFVKAPRKAIVGASVTMLVPTGEYDRTKLINLGNHRWAVKPEVGLAVPIGRWDIDAYAGVWLFTANDDFFPGGKERTQDPILAIQGHVSYTFKPRLWLAVDSTWYSGGKSRVDDGDPTAAVANSRLGATLSIPASRRQSFKIAYSNGVSVRTGTDFSTIAVGWQFLHFRK
jgi:hypothetical protein